MPADAKSVAAVAARALEFIPDGAVVGLGSGKASTEFIHSLADRVRGGLKIRGVPTSRDSEKLALQLGILLTTLDDVEAIDWAVDGADEVDPTGNLIKGYGGALVREKIVAASARRFLILVGPEKLVPVLGSHGIIPVEVVPFAAGPATRRLTALGLTPKPRMLEGKLFITDNGNLILDCETQPIPQPLPLEVAIRAIPGVLGTGLFLDMHPTVLTANGAEATVREF